MVSGEKTPLGRIEPFLFGVTLPAATLLYLATKEPILAAILPCLHGGWKTFRTGLWLLRSDPCRSRARTCFAFYTAAACWKAAAAALASVGLSVFVAIRFGVQPNISEFAALMLVLTGGVVLNTLLGLGSIYAALRCKIRVWVHPRLRTAVHGDLRLVAQIGPFRRDFNHAIFVVATALVFPLVGAGALGLAALTVGKNPGEVGTVGAAIVALVLLFGGPLAMIPCYAWLSSRIIARSPQECWPAMTLDHSRQETRAQTSWPEENPMQCTSDGCNDRATFHVTYVESRRCVSEEHLCEEHARSKLTSYPTLQRNQTTTPHVLEDAKCFDIDLIVISEIHPQQVVYLREVGGDRRVPMLIGIFEATSLDRNLKGFEAPRPLTHDATAMIIRAFGAEVQDVVIDTYEQKIYHAKVRIRHENRLLVVDLRPSDAFILALAFGCPIFFTDEVLDKADKLE